MSLALSKLHKLCNNPLFLRTPQGDAADTTRLQQADPINRVPTLVKTELLQEAASDPATATPTFTLSISDIGEMVFLPKLLRRLREVASGGQLFPWPDEAPFLSAASITLCLHHAGRSSGYRRDTLCLEQILRIDHAVVSPEGRKPGNIR